MGTWVFFVSLEDGGRSCHWSPLWWVPAQKRALESEFSFFLSFIMHVYDIIIVFKGKL